MSRVQTRKDIIIMQPFRKEPFQRGLSIENQVMMAHFRKQFRYRDELLDLHVLRITIQSVCTWCDKSMISKKDFTLYEDYCDEHRIPQTRDTLKCNKCFKEKKKKCRTCEKQLTLEKYHSPEEFEKHEPVCIECKNSRPPPKRLCRGCQKKKLEDEYDSDQWELDKFPWCKTCMDKRPATICDSPPKQKHSSRKRKKPDSDT